MCSYRSGEVDGHQRVRGQKEVIKSQGVFELRQHMAEPRDEPRQGKDGSHLRPGRTGDSKEALRTAAAEFGFVCISKRTIKEETKVFSLVVNRLGQEQERSDKTENQWDCRWDGQ